MNYSRLFLLLLICSFSTALLAQNSEVTWSVDNYHRYYEQARAVKSPDKEAFIKEYRQKLYEQNFSFYQISDKYSLKQLVVLLEADGRFSDLDDSLFGPKNEGNQADSGGVIAEAYWRIWYIATAFKNKELTTEQNKDIWLMLQKAIVHYGNIEISRPNDWQRFHGSCFAIPRAAVGAYFCLLPQMDAVEAGKLKDPLLVKTCDMLKTIALQTWTQPVRNDDTDLDVVQVERFRKHVWWVGGNGLGTDGYRSVFPVAFMYRSIPMIDLLADVCQQSISSTSQSTCEYSFWSEGLTVDGAGWGHGKQCLIWGYPIHGTAGALEMLGVLKDSPWKARLSRKNIEAMMNYFRGGNFYYYKGYTIPCLDRNSMAYVASTQTIPYADMLSQLLSQWSDAFTQAELQELEQLNIEVQKKNIQMNKYSNYNGTRWFFNNDDLVKKNNDYYMMVNMSSNRCDGIESAHTFADAYNFYTTDGTTFFEKTGDEYRPVIGGFDVTAMPGITAREGMERLTPVTNWRGYCSRHNFAAASTNGGENAVAGYIFEKMNGSEKDNVNDKGNNIVENTVLYGVKAYKSYFILGDYMIALGAGVTNLQPEQSGNIRTTIDQTAHTDSIYTHKGRRIEWIGQQGKFAYSVLPAYKKKMNFVCETKKAKWTKMNRSNEGKKNLPETVDIFRLWIDHGQTPVNDQYGYVVYAGKGMPADTYPFKVLRNDTVVQALQSTDGKVIEAVFYRPSSFKAGKNKIQVSTPCTLLLEQKENGYTATVTDAEMNEDLRDIILTLNGKEIAVNMPQGELCGKPVTYNFQ